MDWRESAKTTRESTKNSPFKFFEFLFLGYGYQTEMDEFIKMGSDIHRSHDLDLKNMTFTFDTINVQTFEVEENRMEFYYSWIKPICDKELLISKSFLDEKLNDYKYDYMQLEPFFKIQARLLQTIKTGIIPNIFAYEKNLLFVDSLIKYFNEYTAQLKIDNPIIPNTFSLKQTKLNWTGQTNSLASIFHYLYHTSDNIGGNYFTNSREELVEFIANNFQVNYKDLKLDTIRRILSDPISDKLPKKGTKGDLDIKSKIE